MLGSLEGKLVCFMYISLQNGVWGCDGINAQNRFKLGVRGLGEPKGNMA